MKLTETVKWILIGCGVLGLVAVFVVGFMSIHREKFTLYVHPMERSVKGDTLQWNPEIGFWDEGWSNGQLLVITHGNGFVPGDYFYPTSFPSRGLKQLSENGIFTELVQELDGWFSKDVSNIQVLPGVGGQIKNLGNGRTDQEFPLTTIVGKVGPSQSLYMAATIGQESGPTPVYVYTTNSSREELDHNVPRQANIRDERITAYTHRGKLVRVGNLVNF
jgi:hypothetical protein